MELVKFIFQDFWHFIGAAMLIGIPFNFLFKIWNRYLRSRNIRAHGYPPAHCDADGDFKPEKENDSN